MHVGLLKELRNFILCIIPVWSLFCSVRVYISLHFAPIFFVKLQKQPPQGFLKKGVLRNFAKFTGNHLCQETSFVSFWSRRENVGKCKNLPLKDRWLIPTTSSLLCQRLTFNKKRVSDTGVFLLILRNF